MENANKPEQLQAITARILQVHTQTYSTIEMPLLHLPLPPKSPIDTPYILIHPPSHHPLTQPLALAPYHCLCTTEPEESAGRSLRANASGPPGLGLEGRHGIYRTLTYLQTD